jgi:hypothetical protein
MRLAVVIAVLGLCAASASAEKCFTETEIGPMTCNCGPGAMGLILCSDTFVEVSGGPAVRHTSGLSGLSATASAPYLEMVPAGPSECAQATLPPYHCAWWEYDFEVCMSLWIREGLLFDHVEVDIDITYKGKHFHCDDAPSDACPPSGG